MDIVYNYNKSNGSSVNGLELSEIILNKYRTYFNDQWDYRDLSSTYNDSDPSYSRPVCNSHYTRQMIMYALIKAINGMEYDARTNSADETVLTLKVNPALNKCVPVFVPQSDNGVAASLCTMMSNSSSSSICYQIYAIFGSLTADQLYLFGDIHASNVNIEQDSSQTFC